MTLEQEVWSQSHHIYSLSVDGKTIVTNEYMNGDAVMREALQTVSQALQTTQSSFVVVALIMPFADSHTFARVLAHHNPRFTVQTISCCRDIDDYDLIILTYVL